MYSLPLGLFDLFFCKIQQAFSISKVDEHQAYDSVCLNRLG